MGFHYSLCHEAAWLSATGSVTHSRALSCAASWGLLVAFSAGLSAQVTTASFYGTVNDPSGRPVGGAAVRITNENTGISQEQTTDTGGQFGFTFLSVGSYILDISKQGFATSHSQAFPLRAGEATRQTFTLQLGTVTERVNIAAQAPLVNTVSPEQDESISTLKVRDLPLAQRNLVALGGLTTGALATLGSGNNSGTFNFNGQGHSTANITVDGTDASANSQSPQMMMFGGFNYISVISLEAVQEVQITKGVIPAEFAPTMSGNVDIVTKSGTNQWHGSAFENFQGRILNARYQFLSTRPPFTFNQYGGSLGGPIWKDRLFIFGVYEGYQRAAFAVVQGTVPSETLRGQMVAAVPAYKPVLDALPLPNQPVAPSALTGLFLGASSQRASDNHFVIKPDYWINEHNKVSATYTRGRPTQTTPRVSPENSRVFSGETDRVTSTYTTFGARWSAETRFGYNHNYVNRLDEWFNVKDPNQQEQTPGDRRVPDINVLGFSIGGGEANIVGGPGNLSIEEKVGLQLGKHALKFGGIYFDRRTGGSDIESPSLTYTNADTLLANIPSRVVTTFGVANYVATSKDFGYFVQDDWRLTPRLTINLGLRNDYFGDMFAHGVNGGPPYLYNPDGLLNSSFAIGPYRPVGEPFHPDALNLSPRLGFAYNPDGVGTNVIRFDFGALFSPIVTEDFIGGIIDSPTTPFRSIFSQQQAQALGLRFPVYNQDVLSLVQGTSTGQSIVLINPNIQSPYSLNLYLGYQRALSPSLMLESAFVGNRGVKLVMRRAYNDPNRVTGRLPNPSIGTGEYFDNSDGSVYTSWQTSLRKRYSHNLTFDIHYTWSKALAYGNGNIGNDPSPVQDFFNVKANRGPAQGDLTHVVSADFIYELPLFSGIRSGLVRHLVGGWEVSGILTAQSGPPFDVTQPSSVSSESRTDATGTYPILRNWQNTLDYLNPAAISIVPYSAASGAPIRPGSLGKDAIRAPGLFNLDASFGRNFAITERARLQLRIDMFNSLNHTNLTGVDTNSQSVTFGQLRSTAGARSVQLQGRFSF